MAKKPALGTSAVSSTKFRTDTKLLIGIIIGPLLVILVWFFFTVPAKSSLEEAESAAAVATRTADIRADQLVKVKSGNGQRAQALLAQAQALDTLLPSSVDANAMAAEIIAAANRTGVTLTSVSPSTDAPPSGGLTGKSFNVTVTGTSAGVQSFFNTMSKSSRLVTTANVQVTFGSAPVTTPGSPTASGGTSATATLTVWSYSQPTLLDTTNKTVPK